MSILNIAKCCDMNLQLTNVIAVAVRHNDYHSVDYAREIVGLPTAFLQHACTCTYVCLCGCACVCVK
jgi:hypothetical protein